MPNQDEHCGCGHKNDKEKKSAGNNQWTGKSQKASSPERRDGPGGDGK